MANQKISDRVSDDVRVRDSAGPNRAAEWYLPPLLGARTGAVSYVAGDWQPARGQTRQVFMRPALEKHKAPKKNPSQRPVLQIELELPRAPEDDESARREVELPDRGVAIVDFSI